MSILPRKKKLVNSSLQLKLIASFMAVACLASLFQVVLLNRAMMSIVRESTQLGDLLLSRIPDMLTSNVVLTMGVLVPAMALVGLVVTHRVAGPAHGMEMYLRRIIEEGEAKVPCRIRSNDEMQSLCDAINGAVNVLTKARAEREERTANGQDEEPPSLVGRTAQAAPVDDVVPS